MGPFFALGTNATLRARQRGTKNYTNENIQKEKCAALAGSAPLREIAPSVYKCNYSDFTLITTPGMTIQSTLTL